MNTENPQLAETYLLSLAAAKSLTKRVCNHRITAAFLAHCVSLQIKGGLFAALLPLFPHGLPVSGKERQTSVKHGNRG
jgi:hypothetical protein